MARRQLNIFGLAFLDCMCCGFGAIILLFMIISARIDQQSDLKLEGLEAEQAVLMARILAGERHIAQTRSELSEAVQEQVVTAQLERTLREQLMAFAATLGREAAEIAAARSSLDAEQKKLQELEKSKKTADEVADEVGSQLRKVAGEGHRQYLTGLRIGGQRILILVDASASMLASTLVNVVLRRHLPREQQLRADKWRRATDTVDWLTAHVPLESDVQIFTFGTVAESLLEGSGGKWVKASDTERIDKAVERLRNTVPSGGTSLHAAFDALRSLKPRPDNVYLIVDGLPTQAREQPQRRTVTGRERLRHFESARRGLPGGVPVNVILFPFEGDPLAAMSYWRLAFRSRGSFMSPSEDWP